jgi:hypothetical protein
MAARFDELRSLIPPEIYGTFNPNDKTNLAPYRLLHFVVFATGLGRRMLTRHRRRLSRLSQRQVERRQLSASTRKGKWTGITRRNRVCTVGISP